MKWKQLNDNIYYNKWNMANVNKQIPLGQNTKGKKGAALGLLLLSRAITEIIWQLYP